MGNRCHATTDMTIHEPKTFRMHGHRPCHHIHQLTCWRYYGRYPWKSPPPRGGATPRFRTPTTPPTKGWPEAPKGGEGGGGHLRRGFREGEWGGGYRRGWGGGSGRVGWGGGSKGGSWGGGGGGGVQVGPFEVLGGGGAQAPLTSPCPPLTIPSP